MLLDITFRRTVNPDHLIDQYIAIIGILIHEIHVMIVRISNAVHYYSKIGNLLSI